MLLDLKFSIGTIGIGSGAFIAGLFGMNLKTAMEESEMAFIGVTGFSSLVAMIICLVGLHKLRAIQRVSMWGRNRVQQAQPASNEIESLPSPPPLPPFFPFKSRQHEDMRRPKFGNRRKIETPQLKL